jgi:predicted ATPase
VPGLRIKVKDSERLLSLDFFRRNAFRPPRRVDGSDERRPPCQYVGTANGDRTAGLGLLWDRIALSDLEQHVVSALAIIDENISAVSMVGADGVRSGRIAIVRSKRFARPVPLKSFGDGVNRLFGIVLSLVNAKDGCLLIDEFENGLHHTVQANAWRMIFKIAAALNVQVFATTHSVDAINAFQQVAREVPETGVLVRLARRGQAIVSTVFSEDELAVVARNQIEVR